METADRIIKEYLVTEKATEQSANLNQYVFEVFPDANRIGVKKAVESLFNVKVKRVNILNKRGKTKRSRTMRGRQGRTNSSKGAVVALKEGEKIEMI